jgi:hypothetical protein
VQVIYRQQPKVPGANHFGSRLVFAPDGTLFVTQGDRFGFRERAQDLSVGLGKIARINPDGSIPRDNPFVGRAEARPGSGPTAIAMRGLPSSPDGSSGRWSTARAAVTSSTTPSPARTMAGRS